MAVSTGRDIVLNPAVSDTTDAIVLPDDGRTIVSLINGKLNTFMTPYGEYDGKAAITMLDSGVNKRFYFTFIGEVCGC